jgi:hypothetical protein
MRYGMDEQTQVLKHFTQCLEKVGVAYMLSGSVALSYYAQPRMTRDIDLVVEVQMHNIHQLIDILGIDYYLDEDIAQAAIENESLFNILHQMNLIKIDCIVRKSHIYRKTEFYRRKQVQFAGFDIWIVSAEDLLLSKLDWLKNSRSEMQFKDIHNLIQAVPQLDWDYLHYWAAELDILSLLEEVQQ